MLIPVPLILVQVLAVARVAFASVTSGHPRSYTAPRVTAPIDVDGNIYKKVWEEVPWSHDFVEIRGADVPETAERPSAKTRTRMKMRWDDDFLYVAAEMNANDWPITAEFTARNEPIYQKDSDIEVFLDADGSNSNYKELEVNAKNTVWNLLLDKPYSSNGAEHSGRVAKEGEPMYWDVKGQKTAAKMFGAIGTRQPDGKWTAEMALSHKDSLDRTDGASPAVGKFWRINFSRVEKKGNVNWVWSPQMVWSPSVGKYAGQVNMHAPDAWGYVVFGEANSAAGPQDWVDPAWNLKAAAHQLFHAETFALKPEGGGKLLSPEKLKAKGYVNATLLTGLGADVTQLGKGEWTARVQDSNECVATIRSDYRFSYGCRTWLGVFPIWSVLVAVAFIGTSLGLGACWVVRQKNKQSGRSD